MLSRTCGKISFSCTVMTIVRSEDKCLLIKNCTMNPICNNNDSTKQIEVTLQKSRNVHGHNRQVRPPPPPNNFVQCRTCKGCPLYIDCGGGGGGGGHPHPLITALHKRGCTHYICGSHVNTHGEACSV